MEEVEYLRDGSTVVTSTRVEIDGATFATVGSASLFSEGLSWTANTEVPFFRVNYTNAGNSCVTFEVVDAAIAAAGGPAADDALRSLKRCRPA